MVVETFEIDELTDSPEADNEEQLSLISKLGLKGQENLLNPNKDSIIPYPQCTSEQRVIIATLCPIAVSYEKYQRSKIPLRVLQVISQVREANYFAEILIYDKQSELIKDPFLVGFRIEGAYNYFPHLLARWGDELDSWQVLKKKATEIIVERKKLYKKKILSELDLGMSNASRITLRSFELPDINQYGTSYALEENESF